MELTPLQQQILAKAKELETLLKSMTTEMTEAEYSLAMGVNDLIEEYEFEDED